MQNNSDPPALPPAVQRVIPAFRLGGWISFWVQVVLAVVSTLIFLFAIAFEYGSSGEAGKVNQPGTGAGIFFAVGGLIALGFSIYWAFRYTRLARQLQAPQASLRPKKGDAIQILRFGTVVNLVGILLSLLGAEAISGILLAKAFQSQAVRFTGGIVGMSLDKFIQPLDIFVVLANTHTILAHFVGLVTALWLLNWINKQNG